ncbi:MAG: endonuclease/exonuclease/phosphatase family protein [Luteolibacter sp.]
MSRLCHRLGWMLVALSLFLHFFTVYCHIAQPDRFAAFLVMPIWVWGGIGLFISCFAFCFLRAPLSMVVSLVWIITLLIGADEAIPLAHLTYDAPKPGVAALYQRQPVIRVVTLNCYNGLLRSAAKSIELWQPDIVLLQEVQPYQVQEIANELYGGGGDYRAYHQNGIITRWKIQREVRNPILRNQQATVLLPNGRKIEVVSLHLASAATDLRLWERKAWLKHRDNRVKRRQELTATLQILEQTSDFPNTPVLLGGDFNAPPSDQVHNLLRRDFVNAYASVGTGLGNTYHRRFPILRIDHLYSTRHLTPVRCRAVTTRQSDHRLVVADYRMP